MKYKCLFLLVLSSMVAGLCAQEASTSAEGAEAAEKKSGLPARGSDWAPGPSDLWEVNYDEALAKAAAEHKKVYVLSTGSDWCGWCIKLRNDVLTNPQFRTFAKKNLVLLYLDSPMKTKLPAEQQTHNQMVRKMLNFGGGVPSAKVLDEKGQVLAERSGYSKLKPYMEFLKQAVRTASPKD